ncbi:MAG: PhoH family protein [Sedimentisphaerales bacterium]|nr:PhoH family protein [Sedimentisphaerales bacterium]
MEHKIQLDPKTRLIELFGPADKFLKTVHSELDVTITARNSQIIITGKSDDIKKAADVIDKMQQRLNQKGTLDEDDITGIITMAQKNLKSYDKNALIVYSNKTIIEPFTKGQQQYIKKMNSCDLTFCTGPAGTGKTYLAVAVAVAMLKRKQIRKIVLARPAVEAGERLGFLPGDIQAKVNPYLRPLFDSLEDMMAFSQMKKFIEMDIIEVIPLAFMRGRTLNEAVVICDEAQNTSASQMLMFLTRLGRGSKMIITGDITQIDLEKGEKSGMIDACNTLKGIKGVGFVELNEEDIVRHSLVQNIVQAYDKKKKKNT